MHLWTPRVSAQQKALVHLEDEGTEPNRGTTTIYPDMGPCLVCAGSSGLATNHRALTGAPETDYCGVSSQFTGWLRGVIREGQRRCFQPMASLSERCCISEPVPITASSLFYQDCITPANRGQGTAKHKVGSNAGVEALLPT